MITLMQPSEGVQLDNLLMITTDMPLTNSDRIFTLAHLIHAIVVAVCVTTMAGHLLILMTSSSSQYMTGSRVI